MQTLLPYLEIQRYLKEYSSVPAGNFRLEQEYAINITVDNLILDDGTEEPVWIYNYDMLRSKGDNKIESECRGLIIDRNADIVSMSFPRFFNSCEKNAAQIRWQNAWVETKADGTLITIYNYKDKWYIQTRKTANASGSPNKTVGLTFKERVERVLRRKFGDPFKPFKEAPNEGEYDYCWVFEYVSPTNRIVTPYEEDDLILLSCFNKKYGREVTPKYVNTFGQNYAFSRPATQKVTSLEEVFALIEELKPLDEGYIVVDHCNNRIKVKNSSYLTVARTINAGGQLSPKHFANIVLKGDAEEIASYFKEYRPILSIMSNVVIELMDEVSDLWKTHKNKESRKEFAVAVKHHTLSSVLFMLWDDKIQLNSKVLDYIKTDFLVKEVEDRQPTAFREAFEKALAGRI